MRVIVRVTLDPAQKVLEKRGMQKNGRVQHFMTSEVRRLCDPYVPLLHGPLKNTAVERVDEIHYIQPYAEKNYRENKGKGMRGKFWDRRMLADRGKELINAVARFAGGRAK